jgi:hypothetical protein
MDQKSARKRAKELNNSKKFDTVFIAMTKAHLAGRWEDDTAVWVVIERTGKTSLRIVEE